VTVTRTTVTRTAPSAVVLSATIDALPPLRPETVPEPSTAAIVSLSDVQRAPETPVVAASDVVAPTATDAGGATITSTLAVPAAPLVALDVIVVVVPEGRSTAFDESDADLDRVTGSTTVTRYTSRRPSKLVMKSGYKRAENDVARVVQLVSEVPTIPRSIWKRTSVGA
jgi:hypothetical protein